MVNVAFVSVNLKDITGEDKKLNFYARIPRDGNMDSMSWLREKFDHLPEEEREKAFAALCEKVKEDLLTRFPNK